MRIDGKLAAKFGVFRASSDLGDPVSVHLSFEVEIAETLSCTTIQNILCQCIPESSSNCLIKDMWCTQAAWT